MKKFQICFVLSILLTQSVFASELQPRKLIRDCNEMDRIALSVVQNSQPNYDKAADKQHESWRQRHPIAFGSLVGFGVGFGSIVVLCAVSGTSDINLGMAGLFYGGIGAGVGALIGSFF
jgi:hypothetical protein